MSSKSLFIDPSTGSLDLDEILCEAKPIARLIGLFTAIALLPRLLEYFVGEPFGIPIYSLVAHLVVAIGTGVVLLYVITRSIHLAGDE
jgi:hypothetical protein